MESRGHKPVLRGTRYVCANCGDFLLDVRTVARLRALEDVDPVKRSAVERRVLRDPKLAKRVDENPREVVSTYKLADKFNDFLMNPEARPDLQTPEAQEYLKLLQSTYLNDKTDEMMPWLVREWKKGRIKANPETDPRGERFHMDFGPDYAYETPDGQTETYHSVAPDVLGHWADWYRSDHPSRRGKDIMQMKAPEFHQTIKDWDADMRQKAGEAAQVRGDVEHSYPDGWTVQRLNSEKALKDEGDSMGHCVGGYWPHVQRGRTLIYSLRDPHNEPHATWEVTPRYYSCPDCGWIDNSKPEEPARCPECHGANWHAIPNNGTMEQIQGKANEPPNEEYQKRIKDYFENTFPEEKDRPQWDDQRIDDIDELDPDMGGYTMYHPGDYGLNTPDVEFDWDGILKNAAYYEQKQDRIVDAAIEHGDLDGLAGMAEYAQRDVEYEADQRAEESWETEGAWSAEQSWQEYLEDGNIPYPSEPHISEYETTEEYDTAREEYEEELGDYETTVEEEKERWFETEKEDWLERQKEGDSQLEWFTDLEWAIERGREKEYAQMMKQREQVTAGARPSHPNFQTGEPCYCTFTKHLQQPGQWHVAAVMVCESCGDPLEHGKCKRCDWGQWSNAMGDENPTDVTREVKPAIQA